MNKILQKMQKMQKMQKIRKSVVVITLILLVGCDKPLKVPSAILPSATYTANIPDSEVTRSIQMALLTQQELKSLDIDVMTKKGDVRLIGVVDTQSQVDAIIKLARETEGAHAVNNKLTIKK